MVEPPELLETCHSDGNMMVLFAWKDLPGFENMWKSTQIIQERFLAFQLEDKLKSATGVLVRPTTYLQALTDETGTQEKC